MKRLWPYLVILVVLVVGALLWVSNRQREDLILAGGENVVLQLQWYDQAQFIGFYVAKEKSFYRDEGLNVTIESGSDKINSITRVLDNTAQIGLASGDQLLISEANGEDLKAIGTVFNKSLACFISHKELGVESLEDMVKHTVGVFATKDTENILLSMLALHGIPKTSVDILNCSGTSWNSFIQKDAPQIYPSYLIHEPLLAKEKGFSVNTLYPDENGVRFYSDAIFTTGEYYRDNKDILRRFLRASVKGWKYAADHREEAIDILIRREPALGSQREHQVAMLDEVLKHVVSEATGRHFDMDAHRWVDTEKLLIQIGKFPSRGHVDSLCDFEIVTESIK